MWTVQPLLRSSGVRTAKEKEAHLFNLKKKAFQPQTHSKHDSWKKNSPSLLAVLLKTAPRALCSARIVPIGYSTKSSARQQQLPTKPASHLKMNTVAWQSGAAHNARSLLTNRVLLLMRGSLVRLSAKAETFPLLNISTFAVYSYSSLNLLHPTALFHSVAWSY